MPVQPKSIANLKPAKKGEVRNPKGKEEGTLNRQTLFNRIANIPAKYKHPETKEETKGVLLDKVIVKLFNTAIEEGNVPAIKEILDNIFGKIIEKTDNSHTHHFGIDAEEEYVD